MKSLFLKIFLSYWAAQALFMALAILVTLAERPQREISSWQALQSKSLEEAIQAYQKGGSTEARNYLWNLRQSQNVRSFLFNEQGQEISGRKPPEWITNVERGQTRTADSLWGRLRPMQFLKLSMASAGGHRYTMVMELPPGQPALFGPRSVPGLALGIGVITSGFVCFILARYLTAPIIRLRAATQKLAAGDLSARAGASGMRRHDEMAGLVRDFDGMAERLETLLKTQSRLLHAVSHELRSPLARLNVALALARQRTEPEAQTALDRVERESTRLNELIERLLTIARLESGDDAMQKFPVRVQELIAEIARDAEFEAQSRNCSVEMTVGDDCVVTGDPSLLHSAIENVVRNATRYTREGTSVRVQLEKEESADGPQAVIQIADSGPGVPEEALDKVFRPFYRIDDSRGRRTGGVGLGLSITEHSVRLHGGTVKASNRPEGGLLVEIRLPLAAVQPARVVDLEPTPALEGQG
jgi:two-component system sensor histidine kinase CpxA